MVERAGESEAQAEEEAEAGARAEQHNEGQTGVFEGWKEQLLLDDRNIHLKSQKACIKPKQD